MYSIDARPMIHEVADL